MKNRITFCSLAFLLLLIGKVGEIGALGKIPMWKIMLLLLLDVVFDIVIAINGETNVWNYLVHQAAMALDRRRVRRLAREIKKREGLK